MLELSRWVNKSLSKFSKNIPQTCGKDPGNQRYQQRSKSSLDDKKSFESLEKEIKQAFKREKSGRKSCNRCGKSKKKSTNLEQKHNEQVNIVKIARPEPSKSFKSGKCHHKNPSVSTRPHSTQLAKNMVSPRNLQNKQETINQVCLALVFKYKYFLEKGFICLKENRDIKNQERAATLIPLCQKYKLRRLRGAFRQWK